MATLFTATVPDPAGFALACQLDKGLGPEVDYMALRRAEDRDAAAALGTVEARHLPLREAPHRGYASAPDLFAGRGPTTTCVGARGDRRRPARPRDADLVLAPQAVGGHVDHVQLVTVLRQAPLERCCGGATSPTRCAIVGRRSRSAPVSPHCPNWRSDSTTASAPASTPPAPPMRARSDSSSAGRTGLAARLATEDGREAFRLSGARPEDLPVLRAVA